MNPDVVKAIERKIAAQGENLSLEKTNLAELWQSTGIFQQKLHPIKQYASEDAPHASKGRVGPLFWLSVTLFPFRKTMDGDKPFNSL